jgi:uncharacterized phage protein gp47/JayE
MYVKSYAEIFNDMRNWVITHQTKITDFNEGSIAASMLEAPARELAALYNKTVSNIELYAQNMAYAQFDFDRKAGLAAAGSLVFSRAATSAVEREIPEGAITSTDEGLTFVTTSSGKIAAGAIQSSPIPAICEVLGDTGNVGANKIKNIDDSIYGVDSVNNPAAFSGGVNRETEEEYRARFSEFIIGLGKSSVSGVRATALSINGVRSVSLVEHFPAEAGYNFTLYAENGSGALPVGIKNMIEEVIVGNATTEGVRACGVNARILPPTIVYVNPAIIFRVDGTIPSGLIEEELKTKITNYVNSLKIGFPYEKNYIYNMVMRQTGVRDITTITPDLTTPTAWQIIRPGTVVVEGV